MISPVQNEITTISKHCHTKWLGSTFSGTTNITVTVVNDGGTNKFAINGATAPALTLVQGHTYTFDVSDSSVPGHPLAFKDSGVVLLLRVLQQMARLVALELRLLLLFHLLAQCQPGIIAHRMVPWVTQ